MARTPSRRSRRGAKRAVPRNRRYRQRNAQVFKSRTFILLVFFALLALAIGLNVNQTRGASIEFNGNHEAYFEQMAPLAQKYGRKQGIYPSLILAQSALESGFGQSDLAKVHHNFFGIKRTGQESSAAYQTEEVLGGESITVTANFRAYDSVEDSVKDYAALVGTLPRYRGVVEADTPEEAARALVQGGYATDPAYAEKLIHMIQTYDLKQYDGQ
ncbi:MAG: glycoside hydrolase family 73 protein [Clostridiales bacterium]|nr:glycoside hydrolase family 73 protein [Clostridiales bacterium]